MHGRFQISGDKRRFLTFKAACGAAKAMSRQQASAAEVMWCDHTWKPRICIGRPTAGVFVARARTGSAGYEAAMKRLIRRDAAAVRPDTGLWRLSGRSS
jgi:hypothetical protein